LPGRITRAQTRTVIAATVGAVLEWFDLLVYAMFAAVLAKQFPSVPMKMRHRAPGNLDLRARKDHLSFAHAPETDRSSGW
jgi:hypothetical protein